MSQSPISEKKPQSASAGCILIPFGSVFLIAGLFFFWMIFVSPLLGYFAAKSWIETECTILKSEVKENWDSDGTTYQPIIRFEYEVDRQRYEQDTFAFIGFTSAGRKWARGTVKKYPVGSKHACYYDPNNPTRSVIDRSFQASIAWGLLTLVFVGVGLSCIIGPFLIGDSKKKKKTISQDLSGKSLSHVDEKWNSLSGGKDGRGLTESDRTDQQMEGPQRLKPAQSRLVVFLIVLGIATFWNGIVSVFVFQLFDGGFGLSSILLGLFLTPFVLVGLALVAGLVFVFLQIFNPVVEVGIASGAVPIGGDVDVAWEISRGFRRIQKLTITIEGTESATYRKGTDTITDTELFSVIQLVSTDDQQEIRFGSLLAQIPSNAMHSFDGDNNKLTWNIRVHGSIPWWPDVDESFEFRVKPLN